MKGTLMMYLNQSNTKIISNIQKSFTKDLRLLIQS